MRGVMLAFGATEGWLLVVFFFYVVLLLFFAVAAHVTITDEHTGEVVLITRKKVQSPTDVFQDVVGLWPHGDRRDSDAEFFYAEDTAYEKWVRQQKHLREKQAADKNNMREKRQDIVGESKSNISTFTFSSVNARIDAREKSLKMLNNISLLQHAWVVVYADAVYVHQLLHEDFFSGLNANAKGTPEEQYIHLAQNVFSHTVRNITNTNSVLWAEELIYALQYPMLLGGESVELAERELRSIIKDIERVEKALLLLPAEEGAKFDNASMTQVSKYVSDSFAIIGFTRRAHEMVFELVLPLISHAQNSVLYQLHDTNARIIKNDDSTALLHQELKLLTKQRNRLASSKKQLENLDRLVRLSKHSNKLLSKEAFVAALALIGRVRLEQNTGIEIMDVVTGTESCMAITAASWSELKYSFLYPLGVGILIAATLSWVLVATRTFFLKRVLRSIARGKREPVNASLGGHARKKVAFSRFCLRVNLFVEALVPLFIPLYFVYIDFKNNKVSVPAHHIVFFARPAQRFGLAILVVAGLVVSSVLSSLVGFLYKYTSGMKQREKFKRL